MTRTLLIQLGLIATLFAAAGCPAPAPMPPAPAPKKADVALLKFDSVEIHDRFRSFDATAREFARDFEQRPYQLGGNFVTAVWAKNTSLDGRCVLRGPREEFKDLHKIEVQTIVVPVPDQAKAALLTVETVAADPEQWCVHLYYCEASKQGVSDAGWAITFYKWDPEQLGVMPFGPLEHTRAKVRIPMSSYSVADSSVNLTSPLSLKDTFVRYAGSSEAMRDAYLADLAELEKDAAALIAAKRAQKKVFGKNRGSLPPPHRLVPLNAEEEAAELAKAKEYFAREAQFMRDHHGPMYAALRKSFPVEKCWPELADKKPNK